jgi:hypothetical protein
LRISWVSRWWAFRDQGAAIGENGSWIVVHVHLKGMVKDKIEMKRNPKSFVSTKIRSESIIFFEGEGRVFISQENCLGE